MLHPLRLSPEILSPLTEAVRLQFRLLAYAASHSVFDEAECADYVNAVPELLGRGEAAARWVERATETRRKWLNGFAAHGDQREKVDWAQRLGGEASELLGGAPNVLTVCPGHAPEWQKQGAEFLRKFYDDFSDTGLPGQMLGVGKKSFGRQDFLRAFSAANHDLYVCAACDKARIGTWSEGRVHAAIDHFFPQSLYPHLSIHPFNLVPICHACNSSIKGDTDPLDGGSGVRLRPTDLALPYRASGFAANTFLTVDVQAWRTSQGPFALRPIQDEAEQDQIAHYGRISKIPARWNEQAVSDEIGETLFRRLSQFLRARSGLLEGEVDPGVLTRKLDEFLGILRDENLGRDPLSYPMQWLLAQLAESAQDNSGPGVALLDELKGWAPPPGLEAKRERRGSELRDIVRTAQAE